MTLANLFIINHQEVIYVEPLNFIDYFDDDKHCTYTIFFVHAASIMTPPTSNFQTCTAVNDLVPFSGRKYQLLGAPSFAYICNNK